MTDKTEEFDRRLVDAYWISWSILSPIEGE